MRKKYSRLSKEPRKLSTNCGTQQKTVIQCTATFRHTTWITAVFKHELWNKITALSSVAVAVKLMCTGGEHSWVRTSREVPKSALQANILEMLKAQVWDHCLRIIALWAFDTRHCLISFNILTCFGISTLYKNSKQTWWRAQCSQFYPALNRAKTSKICQALTKCIWPFWIRKI